MPCLKKGGKMMNKEQSLKGLKTVSIIFFVLAALNVLLVVLQLTDSSIFEGYDQSVVNLTIGLAVGFTVLSVLAKLYIGMKGYSLANGKNVKVNGAITLAKVLGVLAAISAVVALVTGNAEMTEKVADCASQCGSAFCYFYFVKYAKEVA